MQGRLSMVRDLTSIQTYFICCHSFSIRFSFGLYGGRKYSLMPCSSSVLSAWVTSFDRCVDALSTTKVTGKLYLPAMSARNSSNSAEVMLPVNCTLSRCPVDIKAPSTLSLWPRTAGIEVLGGYLCPGTSIGMSTGKARLIQVAQHHLARRSLLPQLFNLCFCHTKSGLISFFQDWPACVCTQSPLCQAES